jgi:hypothetical protein
MAIEMIVEWVRGRRFSAILAPAHLANSASDPWFLLDREATTLLRDTLDRAGLRTVPIYYPLAISTRTFGNPAEARAFRLALSGLPIDGIWLRVHPFGSRSGATSVRRFIESCREFHEECPLVATKVGVEGLALLAFGAVGGIEIGIASGEHFEASHLLHPPRSVRRKFGPRRRLYVPELQAYLWVDRARQFFEIRGMKTLFACKDETCCRLGVQDMLRDPRRHFLKRRLAEVGWLGKLPEPLRPQRYLEEILRRATDRMVRAVKVEPSLVTPQKRLEGLRITLGALNELGLSSFSAVPQGRRLLTRKGA